MSNRSSFTSEYIYGNEDYRIVREALKSRHGHHFTFALADEIKVDGIVIPIIQGKIGDPALNCEWLKLYEALSDIKTESDIRFIIMCDGGNLQLVTKTADGEVNLEITDFDFRNCR